MYFLIPNGKYLNSYLNVNVHHDRIHSNNARVSNESQRYALSRFPFPAFIIRFNSGSVTAGQIKSSFVI